MLFGDMCRSSSHSGSCGGSSSGSENQAGSNRRSGDRQGLGVALVPVLLDRVASRSTLMLGGGGRPVAGSNPRLVLSSRGRTSCPFCLRCAPAGSRGVLSALPRTKAQEVAALVVPVQVHINADPPLLRISSRE